MTEEKIPTTIKINDKTYEKITLKGRALFDFMKLARGKNIDRSMNFRNIEVQKFKNPILRLSEEASKDRKCKGKKLEWIVDNIPYYRDEFIKIMLEYMELLSVELNKILIECDYNDLVEVISIGFEMEKEVVEEFTEDNFLTALAIINDALPKS